MAGYFFVFAASLFAVFWPSAGVLYYSAMPFLWVTEAATQLAYRIPLSGQIIFGMGTAGGIFMLCIFMLSGYTLFPYRTKKLSEKTQAAGEAPRSKFRKFFSVTIVSVMALSIIFANIPAQPEPGHFSSPAHAQILVYDCPSGTSYIIGASDGFSMRRIHAYLYGERRRSIDYLVLTSYREGDEAVIAFYNALFHFRAILLADFDQATAQAIRAAANTTVLPAASVEKFNPVRRNGNYLGLEILNSGKIYFITNFTPENPAIYDIIFFGGSSIDFPVIRLADEFRLRV
jgi:hypothetical protein